MGKVTVRDNKSQTVRVVDASKAIEMVLSPRYTAVLSNEDVTRKELITSVELYQGLIALGW